MKRTDFQHADSRPFVYYPVDGKLHCVHRRLLSGVTFPVLVRSHLFAYHTLCLKLLHCLVMVPGEAVGQHATIREGAATA